MSRRGGRTTSHCDESNPNDTVRGDSDAGDVISRFGEAEGGIVTINIQAARYEKIANTGPQKILTLDIVF